MSAREKDWTAIAFGVALMFVVLIFWLDGCESDFERFAKGCDGIATYEKRGDTKYMTCDRGTTDRRPKK